MALLIVEDNPTNAMIIKHLAKKVTAQEIKVAGDGTTALMLCHTESFEILIVDHQLPGMSGLQFVKAVRLMDRYRDIPMVMVTADDQPRLADHLGAEAIHPELRTA